MWLLSRTENRSEELSDVHLEGSWKGGKDSFTFSVLKNIKIHHTAKLKQSLCILDFNTLLLPPKNNLPRKQNKVKHTIPDNEFFKDLFKIAWNKSSDFERVVCMLLWGSLRFTLANFSSSGELKESLLTVKILTLRYMICYLFCLNLVMPLSFLSNESFSVTENGCLARKGTRSIYWWLLHIKSINPYIFHCWRLTSRVENFQRTIFYES